FAMTQTIIRAVIGIVGVTLIVFYTESHCWQCRVISSGGVVFGERKLYYSAEAKKRAGRDWIRQGR
ncbi:hypothetical protein, partial [Nostoc sp.]|uniref:hypothetical protein n=1 Tax=Nostoc sp. TaxID=1180 RepID=UPI00359334BE